VAELTPEFGNRVAVAAQECLKVEFNGTIVEEEDRAQPMGRLDFGRIERARRPPVCFRRIEQTNLIGSFLGRYFSVLAHRLLLKLALRCHARRFTGGLSAVNDIIVTLADTTKCHLTEQFSGQQMAGPAPGPSISAAQG
jgi:hypothetical protein